MTKNKIIALNAQARQETGKQVANLRLNNLLPVVLYGHKVKNQNLAIKQSDFEKALDEAGESTLIDLKVDSSDPLKVLIHDFDRDPVSHKIIHADFYQVNMKEKIKTEVELVFVGEAPAVKNLSGVLLKVLDRVEIECLPGDLVSHFDVDLSKIEDFETVVRVKDLSVPENVHMLTDMEGAIALVEEPRKIEEEVIEASAEEGEEGEAPAEGGEEKKEGEAPAEGGEEKPTEQK